MAPFDFGPDTSTIHQGTWEEPHLPVPWETGSTTSVSAMHPEAFHGLAPAPLQPLDTHCKVSSNTNNIKHKRAEFLCAKVSCFQLKIYCCRISYVSLMIIKKKICDRYQEDKGMKAKPQNPIKLQMNIAREERVKGTTKQSENV